MAYPQKFSATEQLRIVHEYKRGKSVRRLHLEKGCATSTIRRILKRHNIEIRPFQPYYSARFFTAAQCEEVAARFKAGEKIYELAAEYGCNRGTIIRAIDKCGVSRNKRRTPVPYTHAERVRIIELWNSGMTQKTIATLTNRSASSVGKQIQKWRERQKTEAMPVRCASNEERQRPQKKQLSVMVCEPQIVNMFNAGHSMPKISKYIGHSQSAIMKVITRCAERNPERIKRPIPQFFHKLLSCRVRMYGKWWKMWKNRRLSISQIAAYEDVPYPSVRRNVKILDNLIREHGYEYVRRYIE